MQFSEFRNYPEYVEVSFWYWMMGPIVFHNLKKLDKNYHYLSSITKQFST